MRHWHWTKVVVTCGLHSMVNMYGELFQNHSSGSKVIERIRNVVIWPLTCNCDIEIEPKWLYNTVCTSSQYGRHVWWVISKSFKQFKIIERTRNIVIWTLLLYLLPWQWTKVDVLCALNIVSIWWTFVVSYFQNTSNGSKVVERTRDRHMAFDL